MAQTADVRFASECRLTEIVGGTVVGGYALVGRAYYDDRPQGSSLYGETDSDLRQQVNDYIAQQRAECGEAFRLIYPNDSAWQLRIFDAPTTPDAA